MNLLRPLEHDVTVNGLRLHCSPEAAPAGRRCSSWAASTIANTPVGA
jgi:hypothetical protein